MRNTIFAHRLQNKRVERGWSQEDLASHLGSTANTISRWERGLTRPTPYLRLKLAQELGLTDKDLGFLAPSEPDALPPAAPTRLLDPALPTYLPFLHGPEHLFSQLH